MEGLSMDQVVIFKQIFDKVQNDLNINFIQAKRHNVSFHLCIQRYSYCIKKW